MKTFLYGLGGILAIILIVLFPPILIFALLLGLGTLLLKLIYTIFKFFINTCKEIFGKK